MEEVEKVIHENETAEPQQQERQRMSYEDLNNIARQLSEQNRALVMELERVRMNNMFSRLDYLFKVIENRQAFSSKLDFVDKCIDEVEMLLDIDSEYPEGTEDDSEKGRI